MNRLAQRYVEGQGYFDVRPDILDEAEARASHVVGGFGTHAERSGTCQEENREVFALHDGPMLPSWCPQ